MKQPLKGKRMYCSISQNNTISMPEVVDGSYVKDGNYFKVNDVKSALNWMIHQHEERIDDLIDTIQTYSWDGDWARYNRFLNNIRKEYENIMILQEGLSDVV